MMKNVRLPFGVAITCMLLGCGGQQADYSKLGLLEVGGTITLDAEPLAGAGVFFYDDQERCSFAITDERGHYQLMFDSNKSGVTPGRKKVEVWTSKNPLGDAAEESEGDIEEDPDAASKERAHAELVPPCYNKDSILTVEITASDSALDFDLKSDCSTTSPE